MDIQKLKYFHATARLEHITRAAEQLHISQPSLTQSIRALEEELGVPLFRRQGRKVVLTEFGQFLSRRLDELLPAFDRLTEEMTHLKQTATATIRLHILAASSLVMQAVMAYQKERPDVIFDVEQNGTLRDCDISITTSSPEADAPAAAGAAHPVCRYVKKEKIGLAVPLSSPYAAASAVALPALRDESFVLLSESRLFGTICYRFCAEAGFQPKILFESDSPTAVRDIVGMGAGVAFWPEYSWGALPSDALKLLHVTEPCCERDLILELHSRTPQSAYAEEFYRFLIGRLETDPPCP